MLDEPASEPLKCRSYHSHACLTLLAVERKDAYFDLAFTVRAEDEAVTLICLYHVHKLLSEYIIAPILVFFLTSHWIYILNRQVLIKLLTIVLTLSRLAPFKVYDSGYLRLCTAVWPCCVISRSRLRDTARLVFRFWLLTLLLMVLLVVWLTVGVLGVSVDRLMDLDVKVSEQVCLAGGAQVRWRGSLGELVGCRCGHWEPVYIWDSHGKRGVEFAFREQGFSLADHWEHIIFVIVAVITDESCVRDTIEVWLRDRGVISMLAR